MCLTLVNLVPSARRSFKLARDDLVERDVEDMRNPMTELPRPGGRLRIRLPVPLFSSLDGYRAAWARADVLAALTLLAIAVPEQLATARLAGMPPVSGLFAFVAGSVLFAVLGSNPQMSVGADSTIAPLFAVGIANLAASSSPQYIALMGQVAVVAGTLVVLVGVLRLGWIAEFLSAPIISGFLAGVAVIIIVDQLPDFLGLPPASGSTLHRIGVVASNLGEVNVWVLGIGLLVFGIVLATDHLDRRLPGALVGLIVSALAVGLFGLAGHGVTVLGAVSQNALHLGLSDLSWSSLGSVVPLAGVVALVIVSQSAATTRAFADHGGYHVDVGRDFLGVGAGSIVAGLSGSFPVNASPVRTAAVASAGGRTQAVGLTAAVAVVLLLPAAGLLKDVPLATLAAVLVYIASRLFHVGDLAAIARFDRFEFALAMVTLFAVALIGVEQGIAVAVGLAILDRTRLSAQPQMHVMGRIPDTTSWAPLGTPEQPVPQPGVLVVLFATPMWYANAEHFRVELEKAIAGSEPSPKVVVLDAQGMSDIDYTGSRALSQVLDRLERDHIALAFARPGDRVRRSLARSGLLERIGTERLFASVDQAVTAFE